MILRYAEKRKLVIISWTTIEDYPYMHMIILKQLSKWLHLKCSYRKESERICVSKSSVFCNTAIMKSKIRSN